VSSLYSLLGFESLLLVALLGVVDDPKVDIELDLSQQRVGGD